VSILKSSFFLFPSSIRTAADADVGRERLLIGRRRRLLFFLILFFFLRCETKTTIIVISRRKSSEIILVYDVVYRNIITSVYIKLAQLENQRVFDEFNLLLGVD